MTSTRKRAAVAMAAAATLGFGGLAVSATANAASSIPTVNVKMSASSITFSGAGATTSKGVTTLHAGRYKFHVTSTKGDHSLQLFYVHNGYTVAQFGKDIGPAIQNGDVAAVDRIDKGTVFRGGAEATSATHPGDVYIALSAGKFYGFDLGGSGQAQLNITGKAPSQSQVANTGTLTAYTYGWEATSNIKATGLVRFVNRADQPHFIVLQHVKQSTTNAQVKKAFASPSNNQPSWVLKETFDSGAISPGHEEIESLHLPAGKYLIQCFYPDYFTGMPHAFMGMWKLIQLH